MTDKMDETKTFAPKFDNDGLMPAMAIEHSTGTPLMLAFVNQAALQKSLQSGYACFWSRSRQAFWQKGETSGNRLKLIDILIDCDQDSICMMVEMEGVKAACHTGRKSCYYRKLTSNDGEGQDLSLQFTDNQPLFDPEKVYNK